MDDLTIRDYLETDAELLFGWRNDPEIVRLGSLNKMVSWEEHNGWFANLLGSDSKKGYIFSYNAQPIGQVRFDSNTESSCFISIYLIGGYGGKGLGIRFMKMAIDAIFQQWNKLEVIIALVRLDNPIGQKAFLNAGFSPEIQKADDDHKSYVFHRKFLNDTAQ